MNVFGNLSKVKNKWEGRIICSLLDRKKKNTNQICREWNDEKIIRGHQNYIKKTCQKLVDENILKVTNAKDSRAKFDYYLDTLNFIEKWFQINKKYYNLEWNLPQEAKENINELFTSPYIINLQKMMLQETQPFDIFEVLEVLFLSVHTLDTDFFSAKHPQQRMNDIINKFPDQNQRQKEYIKYIKSLRIGENFFQFNPDSDRLILGMNTFCDYFFPQEEEF